MRLVWILLTALLFVVVALGLAITIVPHFLDRIYYRGPASGHFDGQRFRNPDADAAPPPMPASGGRARFMWNQLTGADGRPAWPAHVDVAQGRPPARVAGDRLVVTWVGHATVLIQTQGLNILTDPIWSDRTGPQVGPFRLGPRRVAAPGIRWEDLPPIDVVLLSHDHYDHMDRVTLQRLWQRDRPRVVTSLGNDAVVGAWGLGATALDWNETTPLAPGVTVAVVRAHHWGTRTAKDRNRALWSGFVLVLPGGNVWFAGDTGLGDGRWPAEAAAFGPIRLALIPIGAFRFHPGQMAIGEHIGPVDAVEVYRRSGAARAIPIHWGTFRLSYEARDTPPRLLDAAMRCTGQTGFAPVAIGTATEVAPYAPPSPVAPVDRAALLRCLDTPAVHALR
jgi:L-ascorbate metabolism protein UlaG (beta-lactamase superfamily)